MDSTSLYNSSYDTSMYQDTAASAAAGGIAAGAIMVAMIIGFFVSVIGYVVMSLFLQQLFAKAGVEKWKAWVPVYNNWVTLQLGGQQGFWAILAFIPVVNFVSVVFTFIAAYNIQLKLGKTGVFLLLAIFLYPVWLGILAFDSSKWDDAKGAARVDAQPTPTPSPAPSVAAPVNPASQSTTTNTDSSSDSDSSDSSTTS